MATPDIGFDPARFREMVQQEGPRLARLLHYLGVPRADLDDALQDVFLVAHRRWAELERGTPLGPWLRRVALNVARNRKRGTRRSPVRVSHDGDVDAVATDDPESGAVERRLRARLLDALEALEEEPRRCFVLFEIEGVPMQEIAESLGLSMATAYRRLGTARASLKRALNGEADA